LNYNTTYYYEVASANLAGISSNSSPVAVTTTPAPPANLSAIPGNAQAFLSWGSAAGATSYVVQRSTTSGGFYSTITSTTNTSYTDTTVANGTTYYYVVYDTGPNGTSPLNVTIGGIIFTNNLNGNVTVATGNTLTLGGSGIDMSKANHSVTFNNAITLAATQVWNITNGQSLTVNGTFNGASNTVIQTGGGTLALGVTANDTGANIQVNSGTIQANAGSGILISLNGGTFNVNVADGNPMNVMSGGTEQNVGGNRTWSGNLTGSGPLTVIASSIHTWNGNNSAYTGTITLQGGGSLRLSSVNAVSATTAYNFNGGTMNGNATGTFNLGSLAGSGTIGIASGTPTWSVGVLNANSVFSGSIGGSGANLVKTGTGIQTLSGANTYSGGTTISSGLLQIGNGGAAGTLGAGNVTDNATLTFNRTDAIDDTGFGVISGTGVLDKQGGGRLALTKAHTYSGATTLEAGTLALTNSGAIANSSGIVISAGALFDVGGTTGGSLTLASGQTLSGVGSVNGNFTVGSGAILSPGLASGSIGTLTFSNSLTLASGSTNIFEISTAPLTNSVANISGALTNGGTLIVTNIGVAALTNGNSFKLFNAASYNGAFANMNLPPLPAGLGWNTNSINTNGILSVVALTSPTVANFQVSGANLLISGDGGTANWPYLVLMTTNLPGNWTPVATNAFDASGNFFITLTNAISGGLGQSFYKLQLQ
jgi:fibronectin-binding autotransporter adhesin